MWRDSYLASKFSSIRKIRLEYINVPFSEATQGLFRDGPRDFEPRSDDEDSAWAGIPLSKLPRHTSVMLVEVSPLVLYRPYTLFG
ncbi:hypothetical protein AVEN_55817-1 [Araneus ventricosus]|uniref:Uncharacterized protein n=1 Tax=Araneus ventricosus TaxID=182803 RepID=A0A4Y2CPS4_ARAVE|nr:hypothetical protein AVEN_55817-1 [Araneus ventricosus]